MLDTILKFIADTIDTLLKRTGNTAWTELRSGLYYKTKNGFVIIKANIASGLTLSSTFTTLATLPATIKPDLSSGNLFVAYGVDASTSRGTASLAADGTIAVRKDSGTVNGAYFTIVAPYVDRS